MKKALMAVAIVILILCAALLALEIRRQVLEEIAAREAADSILYFLETLYEEMNPSQD